MLAARGHPCLRPNSLHMLSYVHRSSSNSPSRLSNDILVPSSRDILQRPLEMSFRIIHCWRWLSSRCIGVNELDQTIDVFRRNLAK